MSGHKHLGGAGMTQNQGNVLGDRPCVRQSRINREHMGGNAMKGLLGQDSLMWDTKKQEGAYKGKETYDFNAAANPKYTQQQQQPHFAVNTNFSAAAAASDHPHDKFQSNNQSKVQAKRAQWAAEQQASQHLHNEVKASVRCAGRANQQSFSVLG